MDTTERDRLTPKQWNFIKFRASGLSASKAYEKAYGRPNNGAASRLNRKQIVQQEIQQLCSASRIKHAIDVVSITDQYIQALDKARVNNDYRAEADILEKIAKLNKLLDQGAQQQGATVSIQFIDNSAPSVSQGQEVIGQLVDKVKEIGNKHQITNLVPDSDSLEIKANKLEEKRGEG